MPRSLSGARFLVVDDEEPILGLVRKTFERSGAADVVTVSDARKLSGLLVDQSAYDLLVVDLRMPHLDGLTVIRIVRSSISQESLPILVLSGATGREERNEALSSGAQDFVEKPFDAEELVLRAANLVEMRRLHAALRRQNDDLEERVRQRTAALDRAQVEILERLALVSDYHDSVTGDHIQRVARLSRLLARAMGLGEEEADLLGRASMLHDVGKIAVPREIQAKPGRLTEAEFVRVQEHTRIGAELLAGSQFAVLNQAESVARSHHEWWDGNGYPDGLKGEAIPLAARITAVADVFDALTHKRQYKDAWPITDAIEEIRSLAGIQFDPAVSEALQDLYEKGELDAVL